jgi:short-subunit dehydrogenase
MSLSIFITGGTSGIGLELANKYLSQGNRVAVCGRNSFKFKSMRPHENLSFYQADVVDKDEISKAVTDFSEQFGLDLIIACAGYSFEKKTQVPDFEISRKIIDINLNGVLNTFAPAVEIMLKQNSGHLVAISSVAGFCGFPGVSAYSAAKAGVLKLCEGYAIDLGPLGIDVSVVAPGFVDTPLTQKNHHKMPFLMDASKAADLIMIGIDKKKLLISFPFFFASILKLLAVLPRDWYRWLMKFYRFKYARK